MGRPRKGNGTIRDWEICQVLWYWLEKASLEDKWMDIITTMYIVCIYI
jgi:hypothetical protein